MKFFQKPYRYALVFSVILTLCTAYAMLDIYVIPHVLAPSGIGASAEEAPVAATEIPFIISEDIQDDADIKTITQAESAAPVVTANTYEDENISIAISTLRVNGTTVYAADITLSDASYLQTALASNQYGTNVTAYTSVIAQDNNAIFAVNGDYYGANRRGYVIKNGALYRQTVRSDSEYDDLVIYQDGSFGIVNEQSVSAQELLSAGVVQSFAFGPVLVDGGEITVNQNSEVSRASANNPRTAVGIISPLHYIVVVADGRTSASTGLSLYELAQVMQGYGCDIAYNLDGGGSSTMVFMGEVVNNPTSNGRQIRERAVSDIVYIGY